MTEVESKRITTLLVAAYPAWKPSEATMQLYERLLRPLQAGLAEQAVLQIIRTAREFAPPVGSICHQAARLALDGGEAAMSPEEAWAEVAAAIRRHGSYREPKFSNSTLARAVDAMDWSEVCTNPNVEATRAHFFRLFGALLEGRITRRVEELSGGAQCAQMAEHWSAPGLIPRVRTTKPGPAQGAFEWKKA
ncbi:MAG TPA: hypothetical protein VKB84_14340 [Candidatus Binataceae bacterium]|jgi:hypothetical protein|nr:hypothetical protein [Candidatus Binataceae bacterium]